MENKKPETPAKKPAAKPPVKPATKAPVAATAKAVPTKTPVKAPVKSTPKPSVKPTPVKAPESASPKPFNRFNKQTVKKAALTPPAPPKELAGLGTPHVVSEPQGSPVLTLKDLGAALEKLELSMAKRLSALESEFRMSRGMVKHEVRCTKCAGNRPLIKDKKKLLEALKNDGATFVASEVRLLLS